MTSSDSKAEIVKFFSDPGSSSTIMAAQAVVAPVVQGAALTEDEILMGGGVRIVMLVIDGSPSMSDVAELLRDGFNNLYVPAIQAARQGDIAALRIGGLVFSSIWAQLWRGGSGDYFHTLDHLPLLSRSDYDPDAGYATALHDAILEGTATAMRYAAEIQATEAIEPEIDVIVLSDGADNRSKYLAADVKRMIEGCDRTRVRFSFLYFRTDFGLPDPESYAREELGFDGEMVHSFEPEPGETEEQLAKRVRRLFGVLSKVSASRGNSVVLAVTAVDDEII